MTLNDIISRNARTGAVVFGCTALIAAFGSLRYDKLMTKPPETND